MVQVEEVLFVIRSWGWRGAVTEDVEVLFVRSWRGAGVEDEEVLKMRRCLTRD